MVKIQCFYYQCMHLDAGQCSAPLVHLDPQKGCREFSPLSLDHLENARDADTSSDRDWALSDFDEWYGEDETYDQDE
jgi:hypothetical protein